MNDYGYPCIWCLACRYNICDGNECCEPYKKWLDMIQRDLKKWRV